MRKTIEDHKMELINGLIAARQSILTQVRLLTPDQLDEVYLGSWCIKDLLAHLAGWDATNHQAIQEIIAGQYPAFFQQYDMNWQSYNAQLVKLHRIEPFEQLLVKVEESHPGFITYLKALSADVILNGKTNNPSRRTVTIRNLLKAETRDENKHAAEIAAYFQPHPVQLTV